MPDEGFFNEGNDFSFGGPAPLPLIDPIQNAITYLGDGEFTPADVISTAALPLSVLSVAMDPLHSVLSAGVGWLLEHIALREPLEVITGDAEQVAALASEWQRIANGLVGTATVHAESAQDLPSWTGTASEAYTGLLQSTNQLFVATQGAAESVAGSIQFAGGVIAVERGVIFGLLSDFIAHLIEAALIAAAAAIPTLGGSVAAFTGYAGARAAIFAGKMSRRLADLVAQIANLARRLGINASALDSAAQALRSAARGFGRDGGNLLGNTGLLGVRTPLGHIPTGQGGIPATVGSSGNPLGSGYSTLNQVVTNVERFDSQVENPDNEDPVDEQIPGIQR